MHTFFPTDTPFPIHAPMKINTPPFTGSVPLLRESRGRRGLLLSVLPLLAWMLAAPGSLPAQTAADSVPAGYNTFTAAGTGGAPGVVLSFNAPGLTPDVEWRGTSTAIGANTLTDSTATWTQDKFNGANGAYYIEITSAGGSATAAGVGTFHTITATTAASKMLTFAANLPAGVATPIGYRIRKQWTIAGVFGAANSAGLQGGTAVSADRLLVWNGGGFDTYYYQTTGIGGTGWRNAAARSTDASGTVILPNQFFLVKRGQSAAVSVNVNGSIKAGQTTAGIAAGFNFIANPYAVDMTLASCGIYTGNASTGLAGGSAATADLVLLWNGTGFDTYFYQTSGGTGWRKTTDLATDAGATALPAGTGFIVRRVNSGAFTWIMPPHPASL